MRKRWIMIVAIIGIILISAIVMGSIMSGIETPSYEIITSQDAIEIRQYDPMIIAEVEINGEREDAIGDGFRLLADYIFGNNIASENIPMTAPVWQQENTKIAMTAPVQQQSTGDDWQISFVMPSKYTIETLPKPVNGRVTIKNIPAKIFAVITFSGINSDKNVKDHENELMKYVGASELSIIGTPKYAFYNPPWTLPPMRRNEVMIEIQMQ